MDWQVAYGGSIPLPETKTTASGHKTQCLLHHPAQGYCHQIWPRELNLFQIKTEAASDDPKSTTSSSSDQELGVVTACPQGTHRHNSG